MTQPFCVSLLEEETLLRKTLLDCTTAEALSYAGALEEQENLQWHASLTLHQLSALCEVDEYLSSFPWRTICCLSPQFRKEVLADMKAEWNFVLHFVDKLQSKSFLHTALAITRHQPYRDLMTKAEFLLL